MNKTCIIITGPTAVGKTAVALNLAGHFSTQIISADSRQCYRELNIGVAKPDWRELESVYHHFINSHSVLDIVTAADFEKYALASVDEIFQTNDVAIMVGGTGLYIKAFCEGLDAIPATDESVRARIVSEYEIKGMAWLTEEIRKSDPEFFSKGEMQNPQRIMRALEVKLTTGSSILSFRKHEKQKRKFNIIKIGLELPRPLLYERINLRVDMMVKQGLVKEVQGLIPYKNQNALQTVGYTELFDYFEGKQTLEKAIDLIKQNSRHYAKRQMTWFKKDIAMKWLSPNAEEVLSWFKGLRV